MDEGMSDDVLLEELNKRFQYNKKALRDMRAMNETIEKLNIKLAESERLKTNFLSNIRNEINNPLTSILGMARELAGPAKDEETTRLLSRTIYHEAFDLDFQLRNIFAAAELESGEATLGAERADAAELIRRAISFFAHKAQEKNVNIVFNVPDHDDGNLPFVTDAEKLHLVIVNLLANAIEFNPPGKKVEIEARKKDGVLTISVSDEGAGISEHDRGRLFERFRQLDQGTTKKHRGHGLGLSITKAIVEMLGGKVSYGQAPGGGSVFTIVVPESADPGDIFAEDGNEFLFGSESKF